MKHSDRDPSRKRATAIAEIAVLLALGALVVLAIVVGRSADDAADVVPEVSSAAEPEESAGIGLADTSPPATIAFGTLSADDDTGSVVTSAMEPQGSSVEPEAPIPESDVTSAEPEPIALVEGPFVEVDIGEAFACGLLENGRVKCWGGGRATESVPQQSRFSLIDAGHGTVCGISLAGELSCWGDNVMGQLAAPGGEFVDISAGAQHSCGLRQNGELQCWGNGWGSDARDDVPRGSFVAVESRYFRNCAIRSDGAAVCWGQPF